MAPTFHVTCTSRAAPRPQPSPRSLPSLLRSLMQYISRGELISHACSRACAHRRKRVYARVLSDCRDASAAAGIIEAGSPEVHARAAKHHNFRILLLLHIDEDRQLFFLSFRAGGSLRNGFSAGRAFVSRAIIVTDWRFFARGEMRD